MNYYTVSKKNYRYISNYYKYLNSISSSYNLDINNQLFVNYYEILESLFKSSSKFNCSSHLYRIVNNIVLNNNYLLDYKKIVNGINKYQDNHSYIKINDIRNIKNIIGTIYISKIREIISILEEDINNHLYISKMDSNSSIYDYINHSNSKYYYLFLYDYFSDNNSNLLNELESYFINNNINIYEIREEYDNTNITNNIILSNIFSSCSIIKNINIEDLITSVSYLDKVLNKDYYYKNSSVSTKNIYRNYYSKFKDEAKACSDEIRLNNNRGIFISLLIIIFSICISSIGSGIDKIIIFPIVFVSIFNLISTLVIKRFNDNIFRLKAFDKILLVVSEDIYDKVSNKFSDNSNIFVSGEIDDKIINKNNIKYIGIIDKEIELDDITNSIEILSHPNNRCEYIDLCFNYNNNIFNIVNLVNIKMFFTILFNKSYLSNNYIYKIDGNNKNTVSIYSSICSNNYIFYGKNISKYLYIYLVYEIGVLLYLLVNLKIIIILILSLLDLVLLFIKDKNISRSDDNYKYIEKEDNYYNLDSGFISNNKFALRCINDISYYNNRGYLYSILLSTNNNIINYDSLSCSDSVINTYSKYRDIEIDSNIFISRDSSSSICRYKITNKGRDKDIKISFSIDKLFNNYSSSLVNNSLIIKNIDYYNSYYMFSILGKYKGYIEDRSICIDLSIKSLESITIDTINGYSTTYSGILDILKYYKGYLEELKIVKASSKFSNNRDSLYDIDVLSSILAYILSNDNSYKLEYLKRCGLSNSYLEGIGIDSNNYIVVYEKYLEDGVILLNYLKKNLINLDLVIIGKCSYYNSSYKTYYVDIDKYSDIEIDLICIGSRYIVNKKLDIVSVSNNNFNVDYSYTIKDKIISSNISNDGSFTIGINRINIGNFRVNINNSLIKYEDYKYDRGIAYFNGLNISSKMAVGDGYFVYLIRYYNNSNKKISIDVSKDINISNNYYEDNLVFINNFDDDLRDIPLYIRGFGKYNIDSKSYKDIVITISKNDKKISSKLIDKIFSLFKLDNIEVQCEMYNESINNLYLEYVDYLDNSYPNNIRYLVDTDMFYDNKSDYIKLLGLVMRSGEVINKYNPYNNTGERRRNLCLNLWLLDGILNYISIRGSSILEEEVRYVKSEAISSYDISREVKIYDDGVGSVYEHIVKLFLYSIYSIGPNNLPIIDAGDGYDTSFNSIKDGESVLLGLKLYKLLGQFINISKSNKLNKFYNSYSSVIDKCFDKYFYRYKIGNDIYGRYDNSEGSIYLSVNVIGLSVLKDRDKILSIVNSIESKLVKNNTIRTIDIPYQNSLNIPGDMIRELPYTLNNGGVNVYLSNLYITELFRLGYSNRAYRYLCNSSINFSTIIDGLLGFKVSLDRLIIRPSLPDNISNIRLKYYYNNTLYKIEIVKSDEDFILINGKRSDKIILVDDNTIKNITINVRSD